MRYLLGMITVLIFLGCSDNKSAASDSSISNTDALQPNVENKELQPPKPPAL
ncbi:MAG: hypothetical protein Q7S59_10130 [Sulfurimonas sp.]|nr:hypothetical protein [Sulfurimonas sp.]